MTPMQTIRDFIAAWNDNDMDRVHAFMDEDIFYHNIPMEPIVGERQRASLPMPLGLVRK